MAAAAGPRAGAGGEAPWLAADRHRRRPAVRSRPRPAGVSYAAQYRYVLDQRHQHIASVIEAGALDVGLIIFSLLALGLARAGLARRSSAPR